MKTPVTLLIADDHTLFRDGLKSILQTLEDIIVLEEAATGTELMKKLEHIQPDIILLDIHMPDLNGLDCLPLIKEKYPHIKVVMLSMNDSIQMVQKSIKKGANGYLLKNTSTALLTLAIDTIMKDGCYYDDRIRGIMAMPVGSDSMVEFTPLELQIIRYIVKERSSAEIAGEMSLSIRTIEAYRQKILLKMGVKNAVGLVKYALDNRLPID